MAYPRASLESGRKGAGGRSTFTPRVIWSYSDCAAAYALIGSLRLGNDVGHIPVPDEDSRSHGRPTSWEMLADWINGNADRLEEGCDRDPALLRFLCAMFASISTGREAICDPDGRFQLSPERVVRPVLPLDLREGFKDLFAEEAQRA